MQVILKAEEGDFVLCDSTVVSGMTTVSYTDDDLPKWHWLRNATNHKIKAIARLDDEINRMSASRPIELTSSPNKPDMRVDTMTVNGDLMARVQFYARGASTYTVTCQTITGEDIQQVELDSLHYEYNFTSPISVATTYQFTIEAENNDGTQSSNYYVIPPSATLRLQPSVRGDYVYYTITHNNRVVYGGTEDRREIEISSISFYSGSGVLELSYSGGPHPVDISSLSSGYHIMRVVAASGQVMSGMIRKL